MNEKTNPPTADDYELIEKVEGDLFTTCPLCDPPQLIYKDKLKLHSAVVHGLPSDVLFADDENEDEKQTGGVIEI